MLRMKPITWTPKRGASHILNGMVLIRTGERRVAAIFDESRNPMKARGSPPLARPFTLELYLPLLPSIDRVQKFTELEAAQAAAAKHLERFVSDCLGRDAEDDK